MKPEPMLMIPGPTPVPQVVVDAMSCASIGHRSNEFKAVLKSVYADLQWIFQTRQPVFLFTASGTGAMEAAMVNVLNPGDEILVLACGVFSQRWADIAETLGLKVHLQSVSPGQGTDAEAMVNFLKSPEGKAVKAVYLIHNETSTGVVNDIETLAKLVRANSDALIVVDTITGLGATPFYFDEWGIDIAVSGSQKGFMLPPGLSFLAVSERAMKAHQQCTMPGFYFNFSKYLKGLDGGQTPYTPATTLILGLQKALELLKEEGLDQTFARHRLNRQMVRSAVKAMGLSPFVTDEALASPSVTSILPPDGVTVDEIRAGIKNQFNMTIANGQKELQGKIFRIGHLGAIFPRDMLTVISALELVCHQSGWRKTPLGSGVAAAQEVLIHG